MTTPCYYCEFSRPTDCKACIHGEADVEDILKLERQNAELAKEALNNVLWLERRLPKGYGEVPHIKQFIEKLERAASTAQGGEGL